MRSFKSAFAPEFLQDYQAGALRYRYRDVPCLKSPIDLAIYMNVLWRERPKTLIEIGSKHGGSALFFADMTCALGIGSQVVSIDLEPPMGFVDARIQFLEGDVTRLDDVFRRHALFDAPRPWLVVEDSAHTYEACAAALAFFAVNLNPGEVIVVEDGVLDELGLTERYHGGPNRAISSYFERNPAIFEIVCDYTDMFGVNATYNPNGYLRRTRAAAPVSLPAKSGNPGAPA